MYSFFRGLSIIHVSILSCFLCCWRCVLFFQGEKKHKSSFAHVKNLDPLGPIHSVSENVVSSWGMSLSSGIYLKRQQSQNILKPFSGSESGPGSIWSGRLNELNSDVTGTWLTSLINLFQRVYFVVRDFVVRDSSQSGIGFPVFLPQALTSATTQTYRSIDDFALRTMALRLLLAFFPFIAVAEIEENCNMQLPALQSGNNGDAPEVLGFTAEQGRGCSAIPGSRDSYPLQQCPQQCGCAFALIDGQGICFCCGDPLTTQTSLVLTLYTKNSCFTTTTAPNEGIVDGDPHIQTLDGVRYTLLKQGTFSLWHFSGFKTHVHSSKGIMQAFPVDWQVYVHYSGGKSFTKALLLVDKTGGSLRQALELTSDDCIWKGRTANTPWKVIDDNQLIHKPEKSGLYVSGFNVSTGNRVKLNMNTEHGNTDVAVLVASCRPHHHMNLKMKMQGRKYHQFVDGEFGRHRAGLSVLQMSAGSSDSEFAISSAWEDLGGSTKASQYLQQVDTEAGNVELMQHPCQEEQSTQAQKICQKHLGAAMRNGVPDSAVLWELCVRHLPWCWRRGCRTCSWTFDGQWILTSYLVNDSKTIWCTCMRLEEALCDRRDRINFLDLYHWFATVHSKFWEPLRY